MTSRVYIRPPTAGDQSEFIASARASRKLHHPWTVAPSSPAEFEAYLTRMSQSGNAAYMICSSDNDQIVGVVNVTNIVHGLFRSAYLGYYVFAGHEGRGLMHEGVKAVIRHAFRALKLHRLEANIQVGNTKSIRLVQCCGFSKEGFSPRYLKIGGRWRDHERWAVLSS